MTLKSQILFWLAILALLVLGMWLVGDIMPPFIAGMALAYFLDPLADRLEAIGLPRLAATSVILALALVLFLGVFILLAPLLAHQFSQFMDNLPGYIATLTKLFNDSAPGWLKDAIARASSGDTANGAAIAAKTASWLGAVLKSVWSGSKALFNILSLMVITPIVLFYMLNDWDRMVAIVDGWLPRRHAETIRGIARDIDTAMAGFIRGQGTVCLILGVFYAITLVGAGLHFGLLIGLTAGFLSFIPYVGSTIGLLLSVGMALVQFWPEWTHVLIVLGIFAVGQFMEGNFLSPNLVGGRIGLHPVWMMFALMAFGYLFGFAGLLLAVPLAAAIRVIVKYALRQYLKSPLYLGGGEDGEDGEENAALPEEPGKDPA